MECNYRLSDIDEAHLLPAKLTPFVKQTFISLFSKMGQLIVD
jgi:hypothetical protein